MTEIEQKALALLNELSDYEVPDLDEAQYSTAIQALCLSIEQHEAFKREVSDALLVYQKADGVEERSHIWDALTRFILPKPVDPLVEVLADMGLKPKGGYDWASEFRMVLARRGLEVRELEK